MIRNMECPTCEKECKSEKGMKQHHARTHGESLNTISVKCDYCSNKVKKNKHEIKNYKNTFCSTECENKWRSNRYSGSNHPNSKDKVSLECTQCNQEFSVHKYREDSAQFCSTDCHDIFRHIGGTKLVECDNCGTEYRDYQSNIERNKYHFCSTDCQTTGYSKYYSGQNSSQWKGGENLYKAIRENISDISWSKFAENVRDNVCENCGDNSGTMHLHHIVPVLLGGVNNEELCMTLCEHCHRTAEVWTYEQIPNTNITKL